MKLTLQRSPTKERWMFGVLLIDGDFFCYTLEDERREEKVKHDTAIDAGTYEVTLVNSPKFGKDSLWIRNVPKFEGILIHGGVNENHTSGCILVGDRIVETEGLIFGGTTKSGAKDEGVLARLKSKVIHAIQDLGEQVFIEVRDFPGDHYVDSGNQVPSA